MTKVTAYTRYRTIRKQLTVRDLAILNIVHQRGEIPTNLISVVHYGDSESGHGRCVLEVANKLLGLGLLQVRQDTVNYPNHSEFVKVWRITCRGVKVLYVNTSDDPRNKGVSRDRQWRELDYHCIDKNYAEANLRQDDRFKVERVEHEPWCWRDFPSSRTIKLKPDLFVQTSRIDEDGRNFYHWFIEADRSQERPKPILLKCQRYEKYMLETKAKREELWCCGVFPVIVWVVLDEKRKNDLKRHISGAFQAMYDKGIFQVVLREELADFVANFGKSTEESHE